MKIPSWLKQGMTAQEARARGFDVPESVGDKAVATFVVRKKPESVPGATSNAPLRLQFGIGWLEKKS